MGPAQISFGSVIRLYVLCASKYWGSLWKPARAFSFNVTVKRASCTGSGRGREGIEVLTPGFHAAFVEDVVNVKVKVDLPALWMSHHCPRSTVEKCKKLMVRH